mgnify:CR=1 FL=1
MNLTVLGAGACGAGSQQGVALLAPTDSELLVTALYENGRPDCSALVNTSGLGAVRLYNRQASGAYAEAWKLVMPECSTRGYPNFGLNLVRVGDKLLISAEAAGFRTGVDANGNGGVDQSGAGRVAFDQFAREFRLQRDHGQRVTQHVVQIPRDALTLVEVGRDAFIFMIGDIVLGDHRGLGVRQQPFSHRADRLPGRGVS